MNERKYNIYFWILILIPILFISCENNISDTSLLNNNPPGTNLSLVYSKLGKVDSVYCGSTFFRTGTLGNIDLSNADTLRIDFYYSLNQNAFSEFSIYYEDTLGTHQVAVFQYSHTEGSFYEERYFTNINLYRNFKYRISISGTGADCYFSVKNLNIYKNH